MTTSTTRTTPKRNAGTTPSTALPNGSDGSRSGPGSAVRNGRLGSTPARTTSRRPITAAEGPALVELGAGLRDLRRRAGLTLAELARRAELGTRHVERLEAGERRTRPSTVARIAGVLLAARPELGGEVVCWLTAVGPALAQESDYRERIERRRQRRHRRLRRSEVHERARQESARFIALGELGRRAARLLLDLEAAS